MGAQVQDIRLIGKHKCSTCGDEFGPHHNVRPTGWSPRRVECWFCQADSIAKQMERRTLFLTIGFNVMAAIALVVFLVLLRQ